VSAVVSGQPLSSDIDKLTADEMAPLALEDSMYYHFDEWFARFQAEINRLESATPSKENRVELMKYYFNYAGLLAELTHTLAFTSKYQDTKIAADFIFYSNRVKDLAHEVLDDDTKSIQQEAEADLFLGAAEGYIGIFEYGQGNLLQALVNGFQADNHLEKALQLNPNLVDGYFGLGMYRYGNSRLGGVSNFIMQGGKDLRQVGINHIENAILKKASSLPLALKTLAWFYISEQINPKNKELSSEHPLSQGKTRQNAWALLIKLENRYFKGSAPHSHFKGNKEIAMMKALQYFLDRDYTNAGIEFEKVLAISQHLRKRGFKINPQLISSVEAGIKFCNLMLLEKQEKRNCLKVQEQIDFLKSGGSMVEYDSKKIRSELHAVFFKALQELTKKMNCGAISASTNTEP
jgi:tetratricopeptide (TPR) repeat protein